MKTIRAHDRSRLNTTMVTIVVILIASVLLRVLTTHADSKSITVEYGTQNRVYWGDTVGSYSQKIIPDAETAIEISNVIMSHLTGVGDAVSWPLQYVYYNTDDGVWIMSYWKDADIEDEYTAVVGLCLSVALRESDGGVVRIWFGE